MTYDLEADPTRAIAFCSEAHARVAATAAALDDEAVRAPCRLPGWTVGHTLTHLARNADGHARRLRAALEGREEPRYPGGPAQRDGDIDAGAGRSAAEIAADLSASQERLEQVWADSAAAGWPYSHLMAGDVYPTPASRVRRLREVEMHHVDLGLGYEPAHWPAEYLSWELPMVLETVTDRIGSDGDRRRFLAWITGRGPLPADLALDPW